MNDVASLVAIAPSAFDVVLDIRYATPANITGQPIYARPAAYLHEEAAECLRSTIAKAAEAGYRLIIYDAFRPLEAQVLLWGVLPDARFVSDPRPPHDAGSLPHPRGVAVDLGLLDRTGRTVDMATGFDEMVAQSAHGAAGIPDQAVENRVLLRDIMTSTGWEPYEPEWWHYQLPDIGRFAILKDVDLPQPMMALS